MAATKVAIRAAVSHSSTLLSSRVHIWLYRARKASLKSNGRPRRDSGPRNDNRMGRRNLSPFKAPTRSKRSKSEPSAVPDHPLGPRESLTVPHDDIQTRPSHRHSKSNAQMPRGRSRLPQGNGLCISLDFGATYSAVAFGTPASPKLNHIYTWPGSSDAFRKIPTCIVYDSLGDVRAWGVEAKEISLRKGWVRSEWYVSLSYRIPPPNRSGLTLGSNWHWTLPSRPAVSAQHFR